MDFVDVKWHVTLHRVASHLIWEINFARKLAEIDFYEC